MTGYGLTKAPPLRSGSDGDAIFRRYGQDLYRFCLAILGNREDAQDALQNTMVSALRALPGEQRKIELKPWLYRIAHNESIDLIRRRRGNEALDPELIAGGPDLAQEAEQRERLGRLLADLETLPERQRAALVLRELSGLKFEQIATAIGCSAAVARQTVYEARLSLRQIEAGREMGCDAVTRALSDGDGRVLRRRDIRAHLRSCSDCQAFRAEIEGRSQSLAALAPMPALAAAGVLKGALGAAAGAGAGSAAAGGAAGGGLVGGIGGSLVLKAAATVAVVGVLGIGADRAHVVDLGISGAGPGAVSEQGAASEGAGTAEGLEAAGAARDLGDAAPTEEARSANGGRTGDAATAPGQPSAGPRGEKGSAPSSSSAHAKPSPSGAAHGKGAGHAYGHGGSGPGKSAKGQQKAAENQSAAHGKSAAGAHPEHPAKPAKPAHPEAPDKAKPAGEPASPPTSQAAPEPAPEQAAAGSANGKSAAAPGQQEN